jgi:hypothetical protein
MSEHQKAARFNITIPQALKKRMDEAPSSVNWSAVAAQAFEQKLLELDSEKEAKTMDETIARLRRARELEDNIDYQSGLEAGRRWARTKAKPKELRRAAEYIEGEFGTDWFDVDYSGWSAPFGATDYFVFAVWPRHKDDREAPKEFWDLALGDDAHCIEDADFFRGFGEGAAEIWDQVCDKL